MLQERKNRRNTEQKKMPYLERSQRKRSNEKRTWIRLKK